MNFTRKSCGLLLIGIFLFVTSCKDDNSYAVPNTYNFDNVAYSGQTDRLGMLAELKSYIGSVTDGVVLDAGRLAAMYSNESNLAQWTGTYGSKQMRDKTDGGQQLVFDALLNAAAADSDGAAAVATQGTPGLVTSLDGEKVYFVNANGVEYAQIIEKGLMGALIMHQQTGIYLEPGRMDVDNSTVIDGEGTEMEHHFDESFGYFGVPIDFPTNTDGVRFWGDYCNDRNEDLNTNTPIMNAYLSGRAAISNNDLRTRDEQIDIIQEQMDIVAASTAIHYINSAISNFNDNARRFHALSEAVAFYYACQFNPDAKASVADVNAVLTQLGGNSNFMDMNFYNTTLANLESARADIVAQYGFDANAASQF